MAICSRCGTETQLYDHGYPVCAAETDARVVNCLDRAVVESKNIRPNGRPYLAG